MSRCDERAIRQMGLYFSAIQCRVGIAARYDRLPCEFRKVVVILAYDTVFTFFRAVFGVYGGPMFHRRLRKHAATPLDCA